MICTQTLYIGGSFFKQTDDSLNLMFGGGLYVFPHGSFPELVNPCVIKYQT